MKTTILKALKANLFRGSIFSFILFMGCVQVVDAADTAKSWKPLQDFWGAPGWQEDGAWVLGFPRSDLNVMVKGVPLETALGLTSRFSFRPLTHGWAVRG
ncbi:MAG: DUF1259 domain-containing protein, partial [bacterium]